MILLGALGCSGKKGEREAAISLLERISALDIEAPSEARARQIDALAQLPLRDPELAHVRDQCVMAHQGLLRAELEQDGARAALEVAAKRHGDGGIPPAETQAIAARIKRSNQALAEAQQALPDCDQNSRKLVERFH